MTFIWFVLIFGLVVISHELGHFLLAKAGGIHVVEFAVGMGPTLISFRTKETKYSIKLLPIGGACMFEGEDGLRVSEGEDQSGSFNNANVWTRISTVLAGPIFNFILAFVISMIMVQMIHISTPVIQVAPDGAAYEAGLMDGDKIVALNDEKIYLFEELHLFNRVNGGKEAKVTVERDGELVDVMLTPKWNAESNTHQIGIYCVGVAEEKGLARAKYAIYEMRYCVKATYKSLALLLQGQVKSDEMAGPVGIAVNVVGKTYDQAKEYGWQTVLVNMMNITLLLSVNLGILNLLPLPALDGGRLVFLFIEVLRGKPIPPEKEGLVHMIGLMFFMGLMIFVFFNDLRNIFG